MPGATTTAAPGGGPPLPHDAADDLYIEPRGPGAVFEVCATRREAEMETRDNAVLRFLARCVPCAHTRVLVRACTVVCV